MGRKADGARVVLDVMEAERSGFSDQDAEDALPDRDVADGPALVLGDPLGVEVTDLASWTEHTEGSVPGPGDPHGELHDALEHRGKGEFGGERQSRLDQEILAALLLAHPGSAA
jgi:hypothetical protein